ncbi:MAG TPA: ankyrin repeat domain-containing protein [Gammaproteobacteria bacterium]|nr:ankyrin repeat domain-containing protein [Gammaproteobacteria bacterium]
MHTNRDNDTRIRPNDALFWALENNDAVTAAAIMSKKPHKYSHLITDPDEPITNSCMTIVMIGAYGYKDLAFAKAIVANRREDANQSGRYEVGLHHAVRNCDVEFIELLLKQGAGTSWHHRDYGTTPLHEAIASDADDKTKTKMIDLLLLYGAELNSPKKEKNCDFKLSQKYWPWLLYVIEKTNHGNYNHTRYGYVLFKAVSNGNLVGNLGDETTRKACLTIVARLLQANVDKDWQEPYTGNSCLHVAVNGRNAEMMGLLLSFNCDPALRNKIGRTPLTDAVYTDMRWNRTGMREGIAAGWKNHLKRENIKLRDSLTAIAQSNCKSGFFKSLSEEIFEDRILPYLQPGVEESTTLTSTTQHVDAITKPFIQIKNSARNFLKEYKSFHVGLSSSTSKNLANDLQHILDHEKIRPAHHIQARLNRFFRENTDTRAATLLTKHGLDKTILPKSTEVESKTDFSMQKK